MTTHHRLIVLINIQLYVLRNKMTKTGLLETALFSVLCLTSWCVSKIVIVKQSTRTHDAWKFQTVVGQVVTASAAECTEHCFNTPGCGGSMLHGQMCILYKTAQCMCHNDTVVLSPDLPSRYKISHAGAGQSWQQANGICQQQGMHLLAINSQLEQDRMVQMIQDYGEYFVYVQ